MGCSYPIKIKNPNYKSGGVKLYQRQLYYYVPCGKCLGCQISKRTWLNTACNWEYNHYGCGSFSTLTYDEEHILKLYDEDKQDFELSYKDFQNFMKRLRENIYRKYGVRHEFKYLAVGEYGGKFGRPHIHVLFFGLDFRNNDLDIYNAWGQGIVYNLPIKDGGINYVLKYMDKAEIRKKKNYDFTEDSKPFERHSAGLGKGFILEHIDDIIANNGTYDRGDGKRHSLPKYWLNKLLKKPTEDYTEVKKEMVENHYTNKSGEVKEWQKISKREAQEWLFRRNARQEQKLIYESRDKGIPQEDFDDFYYESRKREMY